VRLQPGFADAYDILGIALAQTGSTADAIARFEQALRLDASAADGHNNLGNALAAAGRTAEAIAQYREALRLDPGYAPAHRSLGEELRRTGSVAEAAEPFATAARLEAAGESRPRRRDHSNNRRQRIEDNEQRSCPRIHKSTATEAFEWLDWGYKMGLQVQAFILSEKGDYADASVLLQMIEKLAPASANTACEAGFILNWQGEYEEAAAAYRRAYDLTVGFASQRYMRAMALRGMGFALGKLRRFD